jgi:hypothetical protein
MWEVGLDVVEGVDDVADGIGVAAGAIGGGVGIGRADIRRAS